MPPESGFRIATNWQKMNINKFEKWQWRHNFRTWRYRQNFSRCFVFLIKFSYWSKFHVNIISGSGVITIFFYKGLTRNPEIGNTLVWVLPNIWRLEKVGDTTFDTNVSKKYCWMLNNARVTAFTVSKLLREN